MPDALEWASSIVLRLPGSLRAIRRIPILGDIFHRVGLLILPIDRMIWAQVQSGPAEGLWIEVYPRTGQFHVSGDAELSIQTVVAERLRPGDVFYDLGANIGLYSLLAARCVGETGRVFSFEPDVVIAERLRRNIARNFFSHVSVIESGVWAFTGVLNFAAASESSPDRGVGTFIASASTVTPTPVPVVSLDDFVRTAPRPTAIKCDVEGAELEVLRGGQRLLASHHPWILGEMHSLANDHAWREFLTSFGYKFSTLDPTHVLAHPV